jgi:hypothetical protein
MAFRSLKYTNQGLKIILEANQCRSGLEALLFLKIYGFLQFEDLNHYKFFYILMLPIL